MNFQHNPTNQLYQNLPLIRSVSKYFSSGSCHQSSSLHYCFYFTTSVSQELYLKKIKYLHFASKHILIHIINGKKEEKFNIPDLGGIRLYLCQVALQGNQTICLSFLLTHTWWQFSWLLSEYKEWYDNQWAIMWMIKANPNF